MGGEPNPRQARGMTLKDADKKGQEAETSSSDGCLSTALENTATSPKREDTKTTSLPQPAINT